MLVQTPVSETGMQRFESFLRSQRGDVLPVARMPGCDPGDAGSNPAHPPICRTGRVARQASAKRRVAGANPACDSIRKGQPTGDGSAVLTRRAQALWVQLPPFPPQRQESEDRSQETGEALRTHLALGSNSRSQKTGVRSQEQAYQNAPDFWFWFSVLGSAVPGSVVLGSRFLVLLALGSVLLTPET